MFKTHFIQTAASEFASGDECLRIVCHSLRFMAHSPQHSIETEAATRACCHDDRIRMTSSWPHKSQPAGGGGARKSGRRSGKGGEAPQEFGTQSHYGAHICTYGGTLVSDVPMPMLKLWQQKCRNKLKLQPPNAHRQLVVVVWVWAWGLELWKKGGKCALRTIHCSWLPCLKGISKAAAAVALEGAPPLGTMSHGLDAGGDRGAHNGMWPWQMELG